MRTLSYYLWKMLNEFNVHFVIFISNVIKKSIPLKNNMHTCDKQAKINFIRYNLIFEKKKDLSKTFIVQT